MNTVIWSTEMLEIKQQQSGLQSVRISKPQSRRRLWTIVALMVLLCLAFATWGVLLNVPFNIASSGHSNTPNNITRGASTVAPVKTLSARQIFCIVTLVVLFAVVVLILCCFSGSNKSPLSSVALLLIAFFTKPPGRPVWKNKSDANSSQARTGNLNRMK